MPATSIFSDSELFKSLLEAAALAGAALGALWTVITFGRNNRVKAVEIVLQLEASFKTHLVTLLEIEYVHNYNEKYRGALEKSMSVERNPLDEPESLAINQLEAVLRHFYVCAYLRKLRVDSGTLDDACAYYLQIICSDERPELRRYVQRFWPTVFVWARLCKQPWPKRLVIYSRLAPQRIRGWWRGSYEQPAPRLPSIPSEPARAREESGKLHVGIGPVPR